MARYQIRTPEDVILEDVIEEMAAKTWEILKAWDVFVPDKDADQKYSDFRDRTCSAMSPFVKTYKLCGRSNICLDEAETTPWSPESHALDACPGDLVYHLFPKSDLDEFLNEIAENSMGPIRTILKPDTESGVLSSICAVFRCVLGHYLYSNRVCGKTELCVYSSSAPISPWKR